MRMRICVCVYFDWRLGDPFIIINTIIKTWTEKRLFTVAIVHRHWTTKQQQQQQKAMKKKYFVKMKWKKATEERSIDDDSTQTSERVSVCVCNKTSLEKLNKKNFWEKNFFEQLSHKYIVFRFVSFRFDLCVWRDVSFHLYWSLFASFSLSHMLVWEWGARDRW